jgi:Calcineurin-like phosphoesterase
MTRPMDPRTWAPRLAVSLALLAAPLARAQEVRLPKKDGSVRFAVIGDTGTASTAQFDVGKQMKAFHDKFPFEFVIMVGDNLYGGSSNPDAFRSRFEAPYAALLAAKVKFYAALGNHDNPTQVNYKDWNMDGRRYYTFRVGGGLLGGVGVRFFVLDSNYVDKPQLDWLEAELKKSKSEWKIAFFHHPLYSSGKKHGSSTDLRASLEPLFVDNGVNVVFAGHDHFYERIKPQKGIYHFVVGAGGSLRVGDIKKNTGLTEAGFDTDYSFLLAEIAGMELFFQAISRTGQTVDAGVITHPPFPEAAAPATPLPPTPGSTPVAPVPVSPAPPAGPTPTPAATEPIPPSPSPARPGASPTPKPAPTPTPKTAPRRTLPKATPKPGPSP